MKNTMKSIVSFLLVITLFSVSVFAGNTSEREIAVTPRYTNIASIGTGLSISASGKANCYTNVTLYTSTNTCTVEMTLQRDDGSGWDDVKTWTGSGGIDYLLEKQWYVNSGAEFQVESTTRVYNANGTLIETAITYSPIKYY